MKHIYDDGKTKIVVEIHDNAPNHIKIMHIDSFESMVKLHLRNIEKTQSSEVKK